MTAHGLTRQVTLRSAVTRTIRQPTNRLPQMTDDDNRLRTYRDYKQILDGHIDALLEHLAYEYDFNTPPTADGADEYVARIDDIQSIHDSVLDGCYGSMYVPDALDVIRWCDTDPDEAYWRMYVDSRDFSELRYSDALTSMAYASFRRDYFNAVQEMAESIRHLHEEYDKAFYVGKNDAFRAYDDSFPAETTGLSESFFTRSDDEFWAFVTLALEGEL